MPTGLRVVVQYDSIATSLAYYVGEKTESTAEFVWLTAGTRLGTILSAHKKRGVRNTANSSTGERT